jgi:hypothetical protein
MMVLLVALDYREVENGSVVEMGEGKDENAFRYFISKLVSSQSDDHRRYKLIRDC